MKSKADKLIPWIVLSGFVVWMLVPKDLRK